MHTDEIRERLALCLEEAIAALARANPGNVAHRVGQATGSVQTVIGALRDDARWPAPATEATAWEAAARGLAKHLERHCGEPADVLLADYGAPVPGRVPGLLDDLDTPTPGRDELRERLENLCDEARDAEERLRLEDDDGAQAFGVVRVRLDAILSDPSLWPAPAAAGPREQPAASRLRECGTCWWQEGGRCYEGEPERDERGFSLRLAEAPCDKWRLKRLASLPPAPSPAPAEQGEQGG